MYIHPYGSVYTRPLYVYVCVNVFDVPLKYFWNSFLRLCATLELLFICIWAMVNDQTFCIRTSWNHLHMAMHTGWLQCSIHHALMFSDAVSKIRFQCRWREYTAEPPPSHPPSSHITPLCWHHRITLWLVWSVVSLLIEFACLDVLLA